MSRWVYLATQALPKRLRNLIQNVLSVLPQIEDSRTEILDDCFHYGPTSRTPKEKQILGHHPRTESGSPYTNCALPVENFASFTAFWGSSDHPTA